MKRQYFTKGNLKSKAKEIFDKVKKYRKYHNIELLPENSALLIIDMQKYFLSPSSHAYIPSAEVILPGLKKLISMYNYLKTIDSKFIDLRITEKIIPVFFRVGIIRIDGD